MRKQSQKFIKHFFLGIIGLLLVALVIQIFNASRYGRQFGAAPAALTVYTEPRAFTVVAVVAGGFLAREDGKPDEINIIVPSDALINKVENSEVKGGSILIANKYLLVMDGVVAQALTILPPPPEDKNQPALPSIPSVE